MIFSRHPEVALKSSRIINKKYLSRENVNVEAAVIISQVGRRLPIFIVSLHMLPMESIIEVGRRWEKVFKSFGRDYFNKFLKVGKWKKKIKLN